MLEDYNEYELVKEYVELQPINFLLIIKTQFIYGRTLVPHLRSFVPKIDDLITRLN